MELRPRLLLVAAVTALALLGLGVCVAQAQPGPTSPAANITATLSTVTCPGDGCVTLEVSGYASASIQVYGGSWSGSLSTDGSVDGVHYSPLRAQARYGNNSESPVISFSGLYVVSIGGLKYLRVSFQSYTSGTADVSITAAVGGVPQLRDNAPNTAVEPGAGFSNVTVIAVADATGTQATVPRVDASNYLYVDCAVGCAAGTPGQTTMAFSSPVVIASDQSAINMTCVSGCGTPPATADGTAFTYGTTNVSPVAFVVDDVASTTVAENAYGIARMTPNRIQYVDVSKSGSNTSSFKVDFGGSGQPVTGTFWQATQPVSGTFWQATQPVSATSLPLPTGASTSALQTTGNTSLANLDVLLSTRTKPADQQHAIIDSGTVTAVTAITNALPAGANVIGHVIVDTTSTTTVTQATGTNLHAVIDAGTVTANAGTNLNTSLLALEATQLLQATATKQDTGNTSLGTIKTNTDPLVTAGGGGYVRQDSTATIAKETGGNLATLVTNTTSIATAAKQDTGNTSVASIDTKTPALGQALAAASVPVVLTAAQVSTLTPPTNTGYALDSSLTTLNAKDFATQTTLAADLAMLTALSAKIVQAQQLMANSLSVTVASNQTALPIMVQPGLPLQPCNAVRRTACQAKGY